MDYPNKVNYFYMDYITWIPPIFQESLFKKLELIYEDYSVYRTIIVCKNIYVINKLYEVLSQHNIATLKLQTIWDLQNLSNSNYRIMLIHFNQMYHYPELLQKYAFENDYLWIMHDLNSLQEQCCLHYMKQIDYLNYYIYLD